MTENTIKHIIQHKPYLIQDARNWAKDCDWEETLEDPSNDFIDEIPDDRLLKLVNRHYDGGLNQFIEDNQRVKLSHSDNHEHNLIKWHDRQNIYEGLLGKLHQDDMRCPDCGTALIATESTNSMGHELIIAYCTNCGFQESLIEKAENLMNKKSGTLLQKLAFIADVLDKCGLKAEANGVDEVLFRLANNSVFRVGRK